jgi:mxaA protein
MKTLTLLLASLLIALAAPAQADETAQDPRVRIRTIEPERNVGYVVGDVLERTVILDVKKPYKLLDTSLPIVGYERRYKGQVVGIELRRIDVEETLGKDTTQYRLQLAYQVFTNNIVAKPAILPPEIVKFSGEGKIFDYRIPSWSFRISPLAVYGSVKVENDMSPFRGPLLLDASPEKLRLKVLIGILVLSLLGLLYIFGAHAWLPRMGGPFARTYRALRKLPDTRDGLRQGVARMHESFNATAGHAVFGGNLDAFLQARPGFSPLREDIERFFGLSRQVYFEPNAAHDAGDQPLDWLRQFCKRCRHCERGMK